MPTSLFAVITASVRSAPGVGSSPTAASAPSSAQEATASRCPISPSCRCTSTLSGRLLAVARAAWYAASATPR